MRSSTSSEGSRLVRIVVPCAQTRVTKRRILEQTVQSAMRFERPAQQATEP